MIIWESIRFSTKNKNGLVAVCDTLMNMHFRI